MNFQQLAVLKVVYLHPLLPQYPDAHISRLNHAYIVSSITLHQNKIK